MTEGWAMKRTATFRRDFRRRPLLHIFVWLGLVQLLIFHIIPMFGLQVAFREYKLKSGFAGIFTSQWAGMKYMMQFLNDRKFWTLLQNTLIISFLNLIITFPFSIIFAIMMTEIPLKGFKRVVQTVSYLPHFISWVIVAGLAYSFFSTTQGMLPEVMNSLFGVKMPSVLTDPNMYYGFAALSTLWKEMGWGSIIYLAAISGIDPSLYESAQIDGAGRIRRIISITLPSIKSTVAVMMIMQIGNLMNGNLEQSMLLGNAMNISRSEIIQLHVYNQGLSGQRYSYSTAAGMFQSVISLLLVLGANAFSKKALNESLF